MNNPQTANAADSREVLLAAQGLGRSYDDGSVTALRDVHLQIHKGDYVAIMGPSGSGKSTLLSLLGALDRPTTGEIFFEGQPLSKIGNLDRFRAEKIGFVFQSFHLLPTLTALENVQIPMFETNLGARQREEKAKRLLERLNLGQRMHHLPQKLSVGERQRVAIARALANNPLLLFADEPTGNLDSRNQEEVLQLFDRLHAETGMALVVVTHSEEVGQRAERMIRIRDGQVIQDLVQAAPARFARV